MIEHFLSSSNFVRYKKVQYFKGRFPPPVFFCMKDQTSASLPVILQLPRDFLCYCGGHKHMKITPHFILQPVVSQLVIHKTLLWVPEKIVTEINKIQTCREKFQIFREISQDFLSGKWNTGVVSIRYKPPLCSFSFFTDNVTLEQENFFGVHLREKFWKTLLQRSVVHYCHPSHTTRILQLT